MPTISPLKNTGKPAPRILGGVTMKERKSPLPVKSNRIERILAIAVVVLIALVLVCFLSVIIGTWLGAGTNDGFSQGVWPTIFVIQYYGLPVAFLLILALLVTNGVRRSRAARSDAR